MSRACLGKGITFSIYKWLQKGVFSTPERIPDDIDHGREAHEAISSGVVVEISERDRAQLLPDHVALRPLQRDVEAGRHPRRLWERCDL